MKIMLPFASRPALLLPLNHLKSLENAQILHQKAGYPSEAIAILWNLHTPEIGLRHPWNVFGKEAI